jgi:hypothetical protein
LDSEVPERVKPTIESKKSILALFFNLYAFSVVHVLPQDAHFIAKYFIDHIVISLAQNHSIQSGDISRQQLQLCFGNSKCHTATMVQEQMKLLRCECVPYPAYLPDLAIVDFYLFEKLKRDSEQCKHPPAKRS